MDLKVNNIKNAIIEAANEIGIAKPKKEIDTVIVATSCAVAGFVLGFTAKCVVDKIKKLKEQDDDYAFCPDDYVFDGIEEFEDEFDDVFEEDLASETDGEEDDEDYKLEF